MPGATENLIQGVGFLYVAPLGTTEPTDAEVVDEPESPWRAVGFTDGGLTLTVTQEYSPLTVDQLVDEAGARLIRRSASLATSLAEATLENLTQAVNELGTTTDEAAGAGTPGTSTFEAASSDLQGEPDYAMVLFDGFAPEGFPRRVILRRTLQTAEVGMGYLKDGKTLLPVTFQAYYVSQSVGPYKIVDQTEAAAS